MDAKALSDVDMQDVLVEIIQDVISSVQLALEHEVRQGADIDVHEIINTVNDYVGNHYF